MAQKRNKKPIRQPKKIIIDTSKQDLVFTYKDQELLAKFISDRAKLAGRKRSGLTSKQQRALTRAVKHARHLGLLPFSQNI